MIKLNVQYINNPQGVTQAVIIPIKEWQAYQAEFEKMKKYMDFYQSIEDGVHEAFQLHKSNKKARTLTDFLNEC